MKHDISMKDGASNNKILNVLDKLNTPPQNYEFIITSFLKVFLRCLKF